LIKRWLNKAEESVMVHKMYSKKTTQPGNQRKKQSVSMDTPASVQSVPEPENLTGRLDSVMQMQSMIGNRATTRLLKQSAPVQAKLEVSPANDIYEQEAEHVADHVVASFSSSGAVAQGISATKPNTMRAVQRIMRMHSGSDTVGGKEVSSDVHAGIQQSRGSGQPLDHSVRSRMEGAFGRSFGNVRIHHNAASHTLNRSLQARAFTTGSDIFFKQGAYDPHSSAGQHLLAHELTHVVQQSGKVNRMMIQRAFDTSGGTWSYNTYKTIVEESKPGAEIELHFTPNNSVESSKVALVQKVKKIHNGKNLDAEKKVQEQAGTLVGNASKTAANRTTDSGEGHWDRALTYTNPVYGAQNLAAGKDISETASSKYDMSNENPAKRSNYQLGHRYNSFFGMKNNVRDAILWDKPNQPSAGPGTEMIFEVSAVSIAGPQKGTFYGSVEWGFQITGTEEEPQNNIIPFTVISQGTPSANMMELAEVWNNKPTIIGGNEVENTKMLTTKYTSLANTIDLTDATAVANAIKTIEDQLAALTGNDQKNANFELKFLKTKLKNLQG
jgi:hypothetical protein